MRIRPGLIKFLVPVIALFFITSCQLEVPVNEIIAARTAVEDAKKFDAEKYAPEEIKKADDLLLQCHNFLTDQKADEAKKAANDSLAAAVEAEKKSLPPYAADKLKKSENAYIEAEQAFAEKFSPEKFAKSGALNTDAKSLYEKNEYKKSAEISMSSYNMSVAARDESLQNSTLIEKEVSTTETRLSELKGDKFSNAAQGNLTTAGASIDNAKKEMEKKDYKKSLQEIDAAKKELDTAASMIKKQKVLAAIQSLRSELNKLQGKSGSEDIKQDLDNAALALNSAETFLEKNNITDAEMKVSEAEKLISGTDTRLKKKNALAAIDKAEKLLVQAKGKDSENKYKEHLDKAGTLIAGGKSSIEAEKFNEGISNAEEAETIINTVLNSMETAAAELAVKSEKDKEAVTDTTAETKTGEKVVTEPEKIEPEKKEEPSKTYTVQWRKKNTDCLWRISEKVYKDAALWPAIYLANKDQIKDPDLIFPGQKFIIPPRPQKKLSYKEVKEQIKEKSK